MSAQDKSKKFAIRIVRFYKYLTSEKQEYVLAKQILKSGTAIGANLAEAVNAQSRRDFLSKINIALKECTETKYWLEILHESEIIAEDEFASLHNDCSEIEKMLARSVKTTKATL